MVGVAPPVWLFNPPDMYVGPTLVFLLYTEISEVFYSGFFTAAVPKTMARVAAAANLSLSLYIYYVQGIYSDVCI